MLDFELWTLKNEATSAWRFRDLLRAYDNPSDGPQDQARAMKYLWACLSRVGTEEDYDRALLSSKAYPLQFKAADCPNSFTIKDYPLADYAVRCRSSPNLQALMLDLLQTSEGQHVSYACHY
jgi:hypothetical protein